jgi:hypothetical protein
MAVENTSCCAEIILKILTSFFIASKISVLSSLRQLLILARRLFSIIGLLLCKKKEKKDNEMIFFVCSSIHHIRVP